MKDLIIIGAGGVGKEVAWIIEQININSLTWNILGFVDDSPKIQGSIINGYPVISTVDFLNKYNNEVYIICAIANYQVKKKIINSITNPKVKFASIIHPSVFISENNKLGEDVIIYPGIIITTNIEIGNHVIISPKCGIGHESKINDYCSLLWNVNISGNDILEEGCLVGSGVTIIQNLRIGQGSIIGAGSVVTKDLPQNCTAVGVPAKVIKN